MEEMATRFGAAILAGIAAIVWLVRLESVALSNRKEIARLWVQRREDLDAAKIDRAENSRMLTEIREDIKKLLRNHTQ